MSAFNTAFGISRIDIGILSTTLTGQGNFPTKATFSTATSANKAIEGRFNDYFQTATENPMIIKNYAGNNILDTKKFVKKYFTKNGLNHDLIKENLYQFFLDAGIQLTNNNELKKELLKAVQKDQFLYRGIAETIAKINDYNLTHKGQPYEIDSYYELTRETSNIEGLYKPGESKLNNYLINLEIKYGNYSKSLMVITAKGEVAFPHSQKSSLTSIVDAINEANTIEELRSMPGMKMFNRGNILITGNFLLNSIFDPVTGKKRTLDGTPGGQPVKLILENYNGLKVEMADGQEVGEDAYSLDSISRLFMDTHLWYQKGTSTGIQHGDKKSTYILRLSGDLNINGKKTKYYIPPVSFSDPNKTAWLNQLYPIVTNQIQRELNRVLFMRYIESLPAGEKEKHLYYRTIVANKERYSKVGSEFSMFKDILSQNTINKLLNSGLFKPNTRVDNLQEEAGPEVMDLIKNDIKVYFNNISDNFIDHIKETVPNKHIFFDKNILTSFKKELSIAYKGQNVKFNEDDLFRAFIINDWIHKFEVSTLFYGDPVQYDHTKGDYTKRIPGLGSTKDLLRDDQGFIDYQNNTGTITRYLNSNFTFKGNKEKALKNAHFDGTWNSAVLNDPKVTSLYYEDLVKHLTAELIAKNPNLKDEAREIAENKLSAYKGMTEADGQGWITLPAYKIMCEAIGGKWSEDQTNLYNKVISGEVNDIEKITQFFPILKMQMWGPLNNSEGIPIMAFHKFSLMPLLPNVIQNKNLQLMHDRMLEQGVHYALVRSGSKLSNIAPANKIANDFYIGDVNDRKVAFEDPDYTFEINNVSSKYFGLQQPTPSKYKDKVTFSTQLKKLAEIGLLEYGIPTDFMRGSNLELRKSSWNSLGNGKTQEEAEEIKRKKSSNYRQSREYLELLKELVEKGIEELRNEVGLDKENKPTSKGGYKKLFEEIRNRLSTKDLTEYELEAIKEDTDLSIIQDPQAIERAILALVNKRIIQPKLRGEADILASITGYEKTGKYRPNFTNPTESDKLRYGTNGLPFYTPISKNGKVVGVNAMKVKIAISGDFKKLLSHPEVMIRAAKLNISTLEALNQWIKDDAWLDRNDHRQMITMTGVRIPVQGPNSIEIMEVFEFLPEDAGTMIITPSEIVAKSGGDFDIDKLTILMPSIDNTDTGIRLTPKNSKGTRGIQNALMKSINSIMLRPENFSALYLPNGTYLLDYLAKGKIDEETGEVIEGEEGLQDYVRDYDPRDVLQPNNYPPILDPKTGKLIPQLDKNGKLKKGISPTRIFEYRYSEYVREANSIGKDALGIGATENVANVAFNTIGMYVNPQYRSNNRAFINTSLLPVNKINTDKGEAISLAGVENISYDNIAELISQAMNGWVDIAKDTWIFDLQGNKLVAPTLLFMIQAGIPIDQAVYFISQPIIREYIEKKKQAASIRSDLYGIRYSGKYWEQTSKARMIMYNKYRRYINQYETRTWHPRDNDNFIPSDENISWRIKDFQQGLLESKQYEEQAQWNKDELFDTIKNGVDPGNDLEQQNQVDILLHFTHLEDMAQQIGKLKGKTKFDNKRNTTFFEILSSLAGIASLYDSNYIPEEMVFKFLRETPQGAFNINDLVIKMFGENLMSFRNNKVLLGHINDILRNNYILPNARNSKGRILSNYENITLNTYYSDVTDFYVDYLNSLIPFVFQNIITTSNLGTTKYKRVKLSDEEGKLNETTKNIKSSPYLTATGVVVKGDTIYVNHKVLRTQFDNGLYLKEKSPLLAKRTKKLGVEFYPLEPGYIDPSDFDQYVRFVMEREVLRSEYSTPESYENNYEYQQDLKVLQENNKNEISPLSDSEIKKMAYELFLRDKALGNMYNFQYLFKGPKAYATRFAEIQKIMNEQKTTSYQSNQYTIFDALSRKLINQNRRADKESKPDWLYLLSFVDSKPSSEELEDYKRQLVRLADSRVMKVQDPIVNNYISEFFKEFDIVAFMQSGQETKGRLSLGRLIANNPIVPAILNESFKKLEANINPEFLKIYTTKFYNTVRASNWASRYYMKDWRLRDSKSSKTLLNKKSKAEAPESTSIIKIDNFDKKYTIPSKVEVPDPRKEGETKIVNVTEDLLIKDLKTSVPEGVKLVVDSAIGTPKKIEGDSNTILDGSRVSSTGKVLKLKTGRKFENGKYQTPVLNTDKEYDEYIGKIDSQIDQLKADSSGFELRFSSKGYGQELLIPQTTIITSLRKSFVKPTIDLSREWKGDLESRPVYTAEGINTMRTKSAKPNEHFGNPWSELGYGETIKTNSENGIPAVTVAANNYKEWLLGTKFQDVKPEQRVWILDQINQGKLDGANLLYSKKLMDRGEGSHAISLAEVVEQLRGSKSQAISTVNDPADYTNHSGGAKGYDAEWDIIGAEFGMVNNKHYLLPIDGDVADPRLKTKGVKPVDATNDIGEVALEGPAKGEAQIAVTNAERAMGRIDSNHVTRNTKKIRNYAQVKNADGIFAIGSLIPKGADITVARGQAVKKALVPQVNGGTSVAVQLGITMGKPTYVFNQVANNTYAQGWYKWDATQKDFVQVDTPMLTKNFAGIGTSSNTTEQGKQAIRDVYANTFKPQAPVTDTETVSTKLTMIPKFNQAAFNHLSKRLFEEFGYQNKGYYLTGVSPEIISNITPVSDQDVIELMKCIYKSE
jgi:hypothetical protein